MTARTAPAKKAPAKKRAVRRPPATAPAKRRAVNTILADVRKHPDTVAAELETEKATASPRPSLVRRLEAMLEPPRPRGPKPPPDPRMFDVVDARRGGASWHAIAESLRFPDAAAAEALFAQAMDSLRVSSVTSQVRLEHERLDRLQATFWPKALRGDVDALNALFRVLEQRAARPRALDHSEDRLPGPTERAAKREVERLEKHAPALAAAALILARAVDDNAGDPDLAIVAARELRISMTQLRGLAGSRPDDDAGDPTERPAASGDVVVPAGRLEALRGKVDNGYRGT